MFFSRKEPVFLIFCYICRSINKTDLMRKVKKTIVLIAAITLYLLTSTSCFRQDYLMFEDGEFDGVEFSDYDVLQNAELEMDDTDRN